MSNTAPQQSIDSATADRLAQLQARRLPAVADRDQRPVGRAATAPSSSAGKGKRRHPAAKSRLAALAMSIAGTGGLATFLAVGQQPAALAAAPAGVVAATATGSAAGSATTAAAVVNGDVARTRFGPVQVQATFDSDGTLTSVQTLQTPAGDRRSVSINDRAVPTLNTEALSAQSAQVDSVSGATYTSRGYAQSLQSAIDEARSAGLTDTI